MCPRLCSLNRKGNDLYTAEGNYGNADSKHVRINTRGYYIKNGSLYKGDDNVKKTIVQGYHYTFSDMTGKSPTFTVISGKPIASNTTAAIGMQVQKDKNTTLMSYGAKLYDSSGNELKTTTTMLSADNSRTTSVNMNYDVGSSSTTLKYTLTRGTTYQYVFWVNVDGKTYTSAKQSFTTTVGTVALDFFENYGNFCRPVEIVFTCGLIKQVLSG